MTLLEVAILLVALVSLGVTWRARARVQQLDERVSRLLSTVYETRVEQRQLREEIERRLAKLDLAVKQNLGQTRFDPSIRLAELYQLDPRAQTVLAAFHIGGCDHCAVDERETLGEAAQQTGADLNRLLAALNNLPPDGQAPELRTPNVHFEI